MDNQKALSTFLILGLALLSIRHLPARPGTMAADESSGASAGSENSSPDSKGQAAPGAPGGSYLTPLRDFLQTECSQSLEMRESIYAELAKQADTRVMIATVPDPIESSFSHLFDQLVDSIQRGAESKNYVLDRFYFPWQEIQTDKGPESSISKLFSWNSKDTEKQRSPYSGKPGALLFRGNRELGKGNTKIPLLFVLLVGETPTFGIDKVALTCALNEAVMLEKGHEVKILSPSFTGSQTSLTMALQNWVESGSASFPKIRIIGGASAVSKAALESCLTDIHPKKGSGPIPTVSFQSMVVPSSLVKRALLAHLWEQNSQYSPKAQSDKMVIFVETNTLYGSNTRGKNSTQGNQTNQCGNWSITEIPFPLHISEARSAYQRESSKRSDEILYQDVAGSKLRIPTETNKNAKDTEPSFAPQMAAALDELSLSTLLAAVSRDGYRYVGIIATDERDVIFLASLIRQQCPDVQLFTIYPTIAFTHVQYSSFLRGMLVANSYPLCAGWPGRRISSQSILRVFPNGLSQAYYNAAVALLGDDFQDLPPGLQDFGTMTDSQIVEGEAAPLIWISVVGERGLHPLCAYDLRSLQLDDLLKRTGLDPVSPEEEEYTYHKIVQKEVEPPSAPRYSFLWLIVVVTTGFGCLWVSYCYLRAFRHGEKKESHHGSSLRELFDERESEHVGRQRFWILLLFLSLMIGFVPLAWPYLALHSFWQIWQEPMGPGKFFLLFWVTPVFLLLVVVSLGAAFLRSCGLERILRFGGRRSSIVLAGTILALAILWFMMARMSVAPKSLSVRLYVERAINFSDGVSPLVPAVLLAAAISCWCLSQLSRLHLLEDFSVKNPLPNKEPVLSGKDPPPIEETARLWKGIQRRDEQVRHILTYPYRKGMQPSRYLAWALLITVVLGFWLFHKGTPTLESNRLFGLLTRIGFIVLTCLLICAWLQLVDLWKKLQQLLGELAKLPLAGGFARLPEKVSSFFGRYLDSKRDRSEQIGLARQQLDALMAEYTSRQTILEKANLKLDPKTLDDWKASANQSELDVVDAELGKVCQECAQKLWMAVWKGSSVDEGFADSVQPGPDKGSSDRQFIQKLAARLRILAPALYPDEAKQTARWIGMAEVFIAIQLVRYISQFFVHLKRLIVFLVVTVLLLLLGVSSYPFQPQRLAIGLLAVAIAAILGVALFLFVQIDRNEIVSRISKTTPNRFTPNWEFVSNFMTYAVPLLGVLVAQLAGGSDLIRSWMEPILRVMR